MILILADSDIRFLDKAPNVYVVNPPQLILVLYVVQILSFVSSSLIVKNFHTACCVCDCSVTICVSVCATEHVSREDFRTEFGQHLFLKKEEVFCMMLHAKSPPPCCLHHKPVAWLRVTLNDGF